MNWSARYFLRFFFLGMILTNPLIAGVPEAFAQSIQDPISKIFLDKLYDYNDGVVGKFNVRLIITAGITAWQNATNEQSKSEAVNWLRGTLIDVLSASSAVVIPAWLTVEALNDLSMTLRLPEQAPTVTEKFVSFMKEYGLHIFTGTTIVTLLGVCAYLFCKKLESHKEEHAVALKKHETEIITRLTELFEKQLVKKPCDNGLSDSEILELVKASDSQAGTPSNASDSKHNGVSINTVKSEERALNLQSSHESDGTPRAGDGARSSAKTSDVGRGPVSTGMSDLSDIEMAQSVRNCVGAGVASVVVVSAANSSDSFHNLVPVVSTRDHAEADMLRLDSINAPQLMGQRSASSSSVFFTPGNNESPIVSERAADVTGALDTKHAMAARQTPCAGGGAAASKDLFNCDKSTLGSFDSGAQPELVFDPSLLNSSSDSFDNPTDDPFAQPFPFLGPEIGAAGSSCMLQSWDDEVRGQCSKDKEEKKKKKQQEALDKKQQEEHKIARQRAKALREREERNGVKLIKDEEREKERFAKIMAQNRRRAAGQRIQAEENRAKKARALEASKNVCFLKQQQDIQNLEVEQRGEVACEEGVLRQQLQGAAHKEKLFVQRRAFAREEEQRAAREAVILDEDSERKEVALEEDTELLILYQLWGNERNAIVVEQVNYQEANDRTMVELLEIGQRKEIFEQMQPEQVLTQYGARPVMAAAGGGAAASFVDMGLGGQRPAFFGVIADRGRGDDNNGTISDVDTPRTDSDLGNVTPEDREEGEYSFAIKSNQ